jgi:hypothetical protein
MSAQQPLRDEEVRVPVGEAVVAGHLTVPQEPRGIVVFAHGSGSSRHSPRNRYVADVLVSAGLATLLFDLLTPAEEQNRANVFDIELLAALELNRQAGAAIPAECRIAVIPGATHPGTGLVPGSPDADSRRTLTGIADAGEGVIHLPRRRLPDTPHPPPEV